MMDAKIISYPKFQVEHDGLTEGRARVVDRLEEGL